MMSSIIALLILIAVVALISLVLAFLFDLFFPRLSTIGKALVAAVIAGAIPTVPFYALVAALSGPTDPTVAIIPHIFVGLVLALVAGFPSAFFLIRRRSRKRATAGDPDVFE